MSDDVGQPDLAQLQEQIRQLQQRDVERSLELARANVYAEHPHLRALNLLEDFAGGPEQIAAFGAKLAQQFPPPPAPPPNTLPVTVPATPSPESSIVPTPSPQDVVDQSSADTSRADDIREKMRNGTATRQEAEWLSQWAPRRQVDLGNGLMGHSGGFVSAARGLRPAR